MAANIAILSFIKDKSSMFFSFVYYIGQNLTIFER